MPEKHQLGLFVDQAHETKPFSVRPIQHDPQLEALATRLPENAYLGTSSFTFPGWRGLVYDGDYTKRALISDGLSAYAHHSLFDLIGLDRTYYRPLDTRAFQEMAEATPTAFRFLAKAHQFVTIPRFGDHPRYGTRAGQDNDLFLHPGFALQEVVEPFWSGLAERAGPLVFQFPPFDPRQVGGARRFAERIYHFIRALPSGPIYAFELRNEELFTDDYLAALRACGAVHCFNSHPTMPDVKAQAERYSLWDRPLVARWMLRRTRGYDDAKLAYEPYDQIVEPDLVTLEQLASLVLLSVERAMPVFVSVSNKAEGSAPLSVERLTRAIVGGGRFDDE
ncbi:MAG: DUF72 domain-containing protein [Myxococcota bacterium]